MARKRVKIPESEVQTTPTTKEFVSTGCTKLDCDLGGGYVLGRIVNIVGDKSTAKTALATEAVINFLRTYPDGAAFYRETEAAFDYDYAAGMGLPLDRVDFGPSDKPVVTVEAFAKELEAFVNKRTETNTPGIYVLDSLDALSDEAEMGREVGEGSYGTAKAKLMSQIFRITSRKLEQTRVLLIVISQVRDKIGVMFGEKHTRSGGRALDFYASQILWLAKRANLERTIKGTKRIYGVVVKAQVKKNKVGVPGRETEMEFHFNYGIEDLITSLNWLEEVKRFPEWAKEAKFDKMSDAEYRACTKRAAYDVHDAWHEIEQDFKPKRCKYESSGP